MLEISRRSVGLECSLEIRLGRARLPQEAQAARKHETPNIGMSAIPKVHIAGRRTGRKRGTREKDKRRHIPQSMSSEALRFS